jgi:hypothetical protein
VTKIDQRKTASAETNLKKADAGRKGKGSTAFTAKVVKSREAKLQERMDLVVAMAKASDGLVNADDVIRHNRKPLFFSGMRAVKVA